MKRVKDSDERLVDVKVIFKNGDERELTLDYFPNEINDIMGYIEYHYLIERIDKVIVKTGGQYWETIYENGHQITDSRKIKDSNIAYSVLDENDRLLDEFTSKEKAIAYAEKNNKADGVVRFKYSEDGDVLDAKEIWTKNKSVSDSKKIKDADDAPDVLDGILMIAFNDGSEEEGYNEVKSHANEQGEIDGVKYETYDSDYQDGVTLIDLCALTDDANAFVKALLKEWGVIDEVADIEFEASDNMKGEVSDSYRVSDMTKPIHLRGYAEKYRKKRREQKENLGRVESIDDLEENMDYGQGIYDSNRVSDMTKPAHLRGYAEKYRKKRREQKENLGRVENVDEIDEEMDRGNIYDSRDARFFVYKNQQDVTPDKEGFVKKADAIAFAKTMLDDNDRTMVEVYRYDENDEWGDVEQMVWTSNNQPKTDLEYWGVKEVEIKKVKEGEYFTLKPIPEPKESQVWVKGGYDRSYKEYDAYKYSDVNSYRGFKPNKKVYVGFTF